MAKVLLCSVALDNSCASMDKPLKDDPYEGKWLAGARTLLLQSAQQDPFGVHSVTDDPDEADLIIFAELGAEGLFEEWVRQHPLVRKYREKCFIFEVKDNPLPVLPGFHASLRKGIYDPARTRTGYYMRLDENPFIDNRPMEEASRYLGCFIGALNNHPVRRELARLASDQLLIEDTSAFSQGMLEHSVEEKRQAFWPHYADVMASAAFALCPRGRGPGSIRLFEALQMGRCPVIIADEWVFPERVNWAACSIVILEKDVSRLPQTLENYRSRAAEMGRQARQEWEKYYSLSVRFHWLVEDCLAMRSARKLPESLAGRMAWRRILTPRLLRKYLVSKKQIYRKTGRVIF